MDAKVKNIMYLSQDMKGFAAEIETTFGAVGDMGATGLCQEAKGYADMLMGTAEHADAIAGKLGVLSMDALAIEDFKDPAQVTKAEHVIDDIEKTAADVESSIDQLDKVVELASPGATTARAAVQYYPVMFFVDKKIVKMPSTCSGDMVGKPIVGGSQDGCASACDANIHGCVGYQYFENGDKKMCFLFSNFNIGFYYTGCDDEGGSPVASCFAKLSKFEGVSLKPSDTCEKCFKTVIRSDRCY
jgi:hypothetical protein